jgi:hypothetical protein
MTTKVPLDIAFRSERRCGNHDTSYGTTSMRVSQMKEGSFER